MSSNASQQPLVLSYNKRRFDGGPEIDMIMQIEQQLQWAEQQQRLQPGTLSANGYGMAPPMASAPGWDPVMPAPQAPPMPVDYPDEAPHHYPPRKPGGRLGTRLFHAVVLPYVELFLGLTGVTVGTMMNLCFSFRIKGMESLRADQHMLMEQSRLAIRHSVSAILWSPWRAVSACWQ